jgi:putative hydrolase of the HAD superfamily
MPLRKVTHILFDADNTLYDFNYASKKAFKALCESLGISDNEDNYKIYHKHNGTVWHLFESNKMTAEELRWKRFDLFFEEINLNHDPHRANSYYLNAMVDNTRMINHARKIIHSLKKDYNLSIITNGLKEVQRSRIAKSNLTPIFEEIIVSDEIGYAKPSAAYFEYAHHKIGRPDKKNVLVVGDNLNSDIKGGLDFGYHTCWYNHNRLKHSDKVQPHYTINKLPELLLLLDK